MLQSIGLRSIYSGPHKIFNQFLVIHKLFHNFCGKKSFFCNFPKRKKNSSFSDFPPKKEKNNKREKLIFSHSSKVKYSHKTYTIIYWVEIFIFPHISKTSSGRNGRWKKILFFLFYSFYKRKSKKKVLFSIKIKFNYNWKKFFHINGKFREI